MITYIIIAITVALSFLAWDKKSLLSKMMMNPYRIHHHKEYYRFVTSGFIHNDHMHLIFNMLSFYFFGLAIESEFEDVFGQFFGVVYFIALYVIAIIVSDLPTYFKQKNNPGYNSLGASGAVSAIIFAFIIFEPLADIYIYFALPIPGFILGTLYILFSWYQSRKSNDNINHEAHLYGALFGLVFCIIMHPPSLPEFFYQIRNWPVLENIF